MKALDFTPSKVTVNMDPVDLAELELEPVSGVRSIEWMVRTGDATVGPVSYELLVRGLNLGRVPSDAQVAPVNSDDWQPIGEVVRDEEPEEPVVETPPVLAAKVVTIEPEFDWPESFAPSEHPPAAAATVAQLPFPQAPPPRAIAQHAPQMQHAPPMQHAHGVPAQHAYGMQPAMMPAPAEEPITIPTQGLSPAAIGFAATLGVSAMVAAIVAIISAL